MKHSKSPRESARLGPPRRELARKNSKARPLGRRELQRRFDTADSDHSGFIDLAELRMILALDISVREAVGLMKKFGTRLPMADRDASARGAVMHFKYELPFKGFVALAKEIDLNEVDVHREQILGKTFSLYLSIGRYTFSRFTHTPRALTTFTPPLQQSGRSSVR